MTDTIAAFETKEERNARENREMAARQAADDAELLRRVEASELRGYRLPDGDRPDNGDDRLRMLLASYRLVGAGKVRSKNEREPWVLVRGSMWRERIEAK